MAFTVDQLCRRAANLTGVSDATGTEDRTYLDGIVNEAIAQVFQDTQCVVTQVDATLVAGQDEYAMDRGILTILNYAQSSANPSAKITAMNAADMLERKFLTSTGDVRYFAVLGGNLLVVSPAPVTNQVIKFYAVPAPDVVDTSDDIFVTGLPTYAQRAVECYVYAKCFEAQRDYKVSEYWMSEYSKEKGSILKTMRRQAGRVIPASRVGYPDRVSTPSRNDTYPRV